MLSNKTTMDRCDAMSQEGIDLVGEGAGNYQYMERQQMPRRTGR